MSTPSSEPRSAVASDWKSDAKELARPALTYQAWVIVMLAIFDLTLLATDGFSPESALILGVISFGTILGVTLGQAMAIARLRGSFLGCMSVFWTIIACLITTPLAALGPLGVGLLVLVWLVPIFVSGGVWSLASSRALFAAWVPVIYGTGAMFTIVNHSDALHRWESGDKLAVWSISTALILFFTIALLLAYLVQRERHRLHLWRFGSRSLLAGSVTEKGAARPRLTMLGWLAVITVGLSLTAGTLIIAPYLFRTSEEEGEGQSQGQQQQNQGQQGQSQGQQGQNQGQQQQQQEPNAGDEAQRALQAIAQAMCPLLIGLFLITAAAAVLIRPIRRLAVIEYLRKAPIPVGPTTRIRMGWRLIEIGLGDLGIDADESVDASAWIARHQVQLQAIDAELLTQLREAARIRDRIAYGLGIEPGDVENFAMQADRIFVIATNRVELQREAQNIFRDVHRR